MKKIILIMIIVSIIFLNPITYYLPSVLAKPSSEAFENVPDFYTLSDPKLHQYVEDSIYAGLVSEFDSEDYIIENVQTIYISKEYLEEISFNSQTNIFFGYTLAELDEQFQGTRYVFTLGDDGTTIVQPFEEYDDTYERALKNVAIGTGVILICVTVSVVSGAVGLVPVSMVFAASATTATTFALSSGAMAGISAGIVEGVQTHDFDAALKAAAISASERFKWCAISGAVVGGALSAITQPWNAVEDTTMHIIGSDEKTDNIPQWRLAELRALYDNGGLEQISFKDGIEVPFSTKGATRPDIIRNLGDHIEAIEVKYYDLSNPTNVRVLLKELAREIPERVANLPEGSTQRIILDVTDRGFSEEICIKVENQIWDLLTDVYPNIPIQIVGL